VAPGTWEEIRELAKRQGVITPQEIRSMGLVAENLNKMAEMGLLVRSGRGIYEHPDYEHVHLAYGLPRCDYSRSCCS
jgi:hypothetical protein